jgi:hypothetical protein
VFFTKCNRYGHAGVVFTILLIERTVDVFISDPDRRPIVLFLLALGGVLLTLTLHQIRVGFDRLEKSTKSRERDQRAAAIIAATDGPTRLRSVDH